MSCVVRAGNDPPSRPLSPTQQLAIMRDIETELARQQLEPTSADLEVELNFHRSTGLYM